MAIIEEPFTPKYFCSFHGNFYKDKGYCLLCETELVATKIYRVKRICDNCGEEFEATVEYFVDNSKCPFSFCAGNLALLPPNDTHHFIFDGQWDGKPMGKRIRERNEQLKKKNEGYSYENPQSLGDRTRTMYNERKKK